MTEVMNPVDIESAIRGISNRIAKGVKVCSDRHKEFLAADRAYDQSFAAAYMAYEGAAHAKKYAAELATEKEREDRDLKDAAYRYAERQHRALQDELRAMQSVGASVRAMYSVAGRGEGL
ncbi:hypothetical protein [Gordonia sp. MMO-8]|uniref:hypothetical protein n=1 Tax=Gordonia sp. MMO-8 TaxID=3127886 RepID=UPI003018074B